MVDSMARVPAWPRTVDAGRSPREGHSGGATGPFSGCRSRPAGRAAFAAVGARLVAGRPARVLQGRLAPAALLRRHRAVAVLALDLDLDVVDHPREVRPDGVHQVLEERERLVLVGNDRLDLGEPAQVDALAQVVHVVEVLAPALVDDLQQQVALERAHELLAEVRLALVIERRRLLDEALGELLAVELILHHLLRRHAHRPDVLERDEQALEIPVLHVVAGGVLVDEAADDGGDLLARGLAHVLALEHLVAVLVDDPALLVHDVVVLEHALADEEVLLLDLPLGLLDLLGEHARLDRLLVALVVGRPQAVEDPVDPVAGEEAHEVVLGGEEEARLAGVALPTGAAAQLVVDAARLVALGAHDEEAAGVEDVVVAGRHALLDGREDLGEALVVIGVARLEPELGELEAREVLRVAAELDVDAAAGHVRRDRDRAGLAGLRDDLGLTRGVLGLGVQDGVRHALALETLGQQLGDLYRDRAHEDRLTRAVALDALLRDRRPLALLGLVDLIVAVVADHGAVRRDLHDAELVDLHELGRLGEGGARHPGELVVHPEVVLEGDGRQRLTLLLDTHPLLGLDRLVQALRPAPALEDAAGELVDDPDLAVDDGVVDVALVERLRLQRLDEVVDEVAVLGAVEVVDAHELLGLRHAALGHRDRLVLLVELEVEVGDELLLRARVEALGLLAGLHLLGQSRKLDVEVGGLLRRPRDDERGAGLVDEDVVDLVDDREVVGGERLAVLGVPAAVLDLLLQRRGHVVAQVVEAELGVRAVRDVARVRLLLVLVGLHVLQDADREAQRAVDRAHPLRVAACQVVVDRDEVDALALQRVEAHRERGGEGLALPRLHLGDVAAVEDHAADELHVEVAHAHRAPAGLADDRERLGEEVVERLSVLRALAQHVHPLPQLVVGLELELGLVVADPGDALLVLAELLRLADVQRTVKDAHALERTNGWFNSRPFRPMTWGDGTVGHNGGRAGRP